MKCSYCNCENKINSVFCINCGRKLIDKKYDYDSFHTAQNLANIINSYEIKSKNANLLYKKFGTPISENGRDEIRNKLLASVCMNQEEIKAQNLELINQNDKIIELLSKIAKE